MQVLHPIRLVLALFILIFFTQSNLNAFKSYRILNYSNRLGGTITFDAQIWIMQQMREGGYDGLRLNNNNLASLPPTFIADLQELHIRFLDLSNNDFSAIPDGLTQISTLRQLDISNNKFKKLPETLDEFSHLRNISVANNDLQALPVAFLSMPRLLQLDISNNPQLSVRQDYAKAYVGISAYRKEHVNYQGCAPKTIESFNAVTNR